MRAGIGFDVHAFAGAEAPRPLVLGGVVVEGSPGLAGHSDGDVVVHAVVDAVLGAAGLGDIGAVYGIDDPALAGASSLGLLPDVASRITAAGLRIANVDVVVIALRPRIAPHAPAMAAAVAEALEVPTGSVSIKATSTDGLGFTGRGEGIAATAIALLLAR